jgi:hypothetical protein
MCLPNVENQSDEGTPDTQIPQTEVVYISYLITRIIFIWRKGYVIGHFTVNLTQFFPFCSYSVIAHRLFHKQRPRTVSIVTIWF